MTTINDRPGTAEDTRWNLWPDWLGWNPKLAQLLDRPWRHAEIYTPGDHVAESDNGFTVELDLPGVTKEDITLEVSGRRLSVHGQRASGDSSGVLRQSTRMVGSFSYELILPAAVEESKVSARLADGVLTVSLPKSQGAKTTHIPIG
ncbi:MAG TPA: Hsp20/alpha crystallin family protein [Nakamurella sp.]|nr:Hsp20/alpha crystallin family protein [Nakamurella sp.]